MKKYLKLLIAILTFITILSVILVKPLNNLDEIWNYNFARNIHNNLIPYKDFNMLPMPLLPVVCGIFLKLIANELIVMRILATVLAFCILFMMYKILKILETKENISIIITFFIGLLLINYFCIDYNWTSLVLILMLIYSEIKQYKKDNMILKSNIKKDIILGILAGLTFTLKQTSGLLICMVTLGNKLLFVRNKKDFYTYIKSFAYRLIGVFVPIIIMVAYLMSNVALKDFVSYTVKGVAEFSNYISYLSLLKFDVIGLFAVLVPIYIIYPVYKVARQKDMNLYYLLIYGFAMFIIVFPISDEIHFLIGATPIILAMFYELGKVLNKIKIDKIILTSLYILIAICIMVLPTVNLCIYINNQENYSKLNHYNYVIIEKEFENEIIEICEYIKKSAKEVKILDARAAVYMIPVDRYNKNYDLLLKGNLGENGEEKIIEEIKNTENTQYLIVKNEKLLNWQTPLNILEYVKNTKSKVGEIGIFDIYE